MTRNFVEITNMGFVTEMVIWILVIVGISLLFSPGGSEPIIGMFNSISEKFSNSIDQDELSRDCSKEFSKYSSALESKYGVDVRIIEKGRIESQ